MKKVLFIIGHLGLGGAEIQLFHLASYLREFGYDPYVAVLVPGGRIESWFRDREIPLHILRRSRLNRVGRVAQLHRCIRIVKPDIIHTKLMDANLAGGLAALLISGQYMSVPASIGFIAIFGIALEDGLVLLSTIRRRTNLGDSPERAVEYGVTTKLRPVVMTTFTTVFGILPLLLARGPGAEIWRPLATVVVGGLLTSTLVTLIVLPMVFERFEPSNQATA